MSFRRRIALLAAAAVAVAVVLASAAHLPARRAPAARAGRHPAARPRARPAVHREPPRGHAGTHRACSPAPPAATPSASLSPRPNQVRGYQQLVNSSGKILRRSGSAQVTLPVSAAHARARGTRRAARSSATRASTASTCGSSPRRVRPGLAVQFAQPLTEVDHLLSRLRLILALIALGGIALAALLGGSSRAPSSRPSGA